MELRHHPLMSCNGRRSWPPVWTWIGGKQDEYVHGEVGVLREVRVHHAQWTKCFLVIDHDDRLYMGCILISDEAFARQLYRVLERCRGKTIKEIGGLDLSATL